MPKTTPEEDKTKGKWVMVPRDLNIRSGIWYGLKDRYNLS